MIGQPVEDFDATVDVPKKYRNRWLISGGNPRQQGSLGRASMEIIFTKFDGCCTTDDYFRHNGRPKDLRWDIEHGNTYMTHRGANRPSDKEINDAKKKFQDE